MSGYCPLCGGYHDEGACHYPNGEDHVWCSDIIYNAICCDTCKEFNTCQSPNRKDRQMPSRQVPVEPPLQISMPVSQYNESLRNAKLFALQQVREAVEELKRGDGYTDYTDCTMKMDKEYFIMKQGEIMFSSSDVTELEILHQIARDAAEGQRGNIGLYLAKELMLSGAAKASLNLAISAAKLEIPE